MFPRSRSINTEIDIQVIVPAWRPAQIQGREAYV